MIEKSIERGICGFFVLLWFLNLPRVYEIIEAVYDRMTRLIPPTLNEFLRFNQPRQIGWI